MGMFDSVTVKCPRCEQNNTVQSKAGNCKLINYASTRVPVEIARDLDEYQIDCNNCGYLITLEYPHQMFVSIEVK
jgi:ribosomal protein S27E